MLFDREARGRFSLLNAPVGLLLWPSVKSSLVFRFASSCCCFSYPHRKHVV